MKIYPNQKQFLNEIAEEARKQLPHEDFALRIVSIRMDKMEASVSFSDTTQTRIETVRVDLTS